MKVVFHFLVVGFDFLTSFFSYFMCPSLSLALIDTTCFCTEFNQSTSQKIECGESDERADPGVVRNPLGHGLGELCGGSVLERIPWWEELVHQKDG